MLFEIQGDDPSDFFAQATKPDATPEDRAAFVDVDGQKIQVRFLKNGPEIMASAMIYYNEDWMFGFDPMIVAKFNATHLFGGGFCLAVHPGHGVIDINQTINIGGIDEGRFLDWLERFADQAAHATKWFYEEHRKILEDLEASTARMDDEALTAFG